MSDSKKIVLITGCSEGGIGEALCLELDRVGWQVVATSRNVDTVKPIVKKIPDLEILPLDVKNPTSIQDAVEKIVSKFGKIDMLINNAGFAVYGPVIEVDPEDALENYNTNVVGVLRVSKAVVPTMVKQGFGRIVNIGSISGVITTPFSSVYCSTKAALHSISDGLRMELEPFGIDVMVVAPGSIRTSFGLKGTKPPKEDPNSMYSPILERIHERTLLSTKPSSTNVNTFARATVAQITRSRPRAYFFYGKFSFLGRIAKMLVPWWLLDLVMRNGAGLGYLKKFRLTSSSDKKQD